MSNSYTTVCKLWKWQSEKAAWHFFTINKEISDEIKFKTEPGFKRGFISVKVDVTIGKTTWETSIFQSKSKGFILPVKASVRNAENINEGDTVKISFTTK